MPCSVILPSSLFTFAHNGSSRDWPTIICRTRFGLLSGDCAFVNGLHIYCHHRNKRCKHEPRELSGHPICFVMKSRQKNAKSRNRRSSCAVCWFRGVSWKAWVIEMALARERTRSGVWVSSAHYPTFYGISHDIFCNLSRCFPLYGVDADGLPLRWQSREMGTTLRCLEEIWNKPGMSITKERNG